MIKDEEIIRFTWPGWINNQGKRMFYVDKFELDRIDFELLNIDFITSYFSFKHITITKEAQTYTITGYAKDLILENEFDGLKVLLSHIPSSLLDTVIVEYTFKLDTDLIITRHLIIDNPELNLYFNQTIVYTYSKSIFTPTYPISDQNYQITTPFLISQVYMDTDLLEVTHGGGTHSSHFYRGFLEKGVYQFEHFHHDLWFKIFDSNQIHLDQGVAPIYMRHPFFEINESGYYYIEIIRKSPFLPNYQFQLIKTDLNDFVYDAIEINISEPTMLILESIDDIIKLKYTVHTEETILISISSLKNVEFIFHISNAEYITIISNETLLTLSPGVFYFYLRTNDATSVDIDVEVTFIPFLE